MEIKKTNKPIAGVYKITCKYNNKIYIGESSDIYRRRCQHFNGDTNHKLHHDILEYGRYNIKFEILELCKDEERRKERELFYIMKNKSYFEDIGYNMHFLIPDHLKHKRLNRKKISILRLMNGLSRKGLSLKIGCTEKQMKNIETNGPKPEMVRLYRLASVLGCEIDDLFKGRKRDETA